MATVHKLLTPEEIAARAGSRIPFLHLGERREIFAARAARLRSLAPGHAMGGYLDFVATVAEAQQAVLDDMPPIWPPTQEVIERCQEHGMPPLGFADHPRQAGWRDGLRQMLRRLSDTLDGPARAVAVGLGASRDDLFEAQASKLLAGAPFGLDVGKAPFIAAGLQIYFTHLALVLGETDIRPIDVATVCPACGSRPTASVARIGAEAAGYRFLHCSLCSTEWHMVRVKCARCESTKGISYSGLSALGDGREVVKNPVMAETCDECNHYLKICYMDRDPAVDPCADDLASIALDLLVVDAGREPWGVNFMLIHGDPEATSPEGDDS